MPAARIFFIFSRQVPIIVTAGQIHSAASQTDFESTEITPKTALKNCRPGREQTFIAINRPITAELGVKSTFDLRHSSFRVRYSLFAFSMFLYRLGRPFFWPAAALNPESLNPGPRTSSFILDFRWLLY